MKRQRMNIDKILTDDVLIFAYRRKLWRKYHKLKKYKLSDEVIEFLLFLEKHNHIDDFIKLFKKYSEEVCVDNDNLIYYKKNTGTLKEYFEDRPQRFYLRGAYRWYRYEYKHVWEGLNELWNEQIKK